MRILRSWNTCRSGSTLLAQQFPSYSLVLTKSAVLFTALQGIQRQVRLTATVVILDAALVAPPLEPVTTLSSEQQLQCRVNEEEDTENMYRIGNSFRKAVLQVVRTHLLGHSRRWPRTC